MARWWGESTGVRLCGVRRGVPAGGAIGDRGSDWLPRGIAGVCEWPRDELAGVCEWPQAVLGWPDRDEGAWLPVLDV
jgi:hypothetical protein